MLHPKEDREDKQLFMVCKTCEHFEEAKSNITYHINYEKKRTANSVLVDDIINDPTLPRIHVECKKCGGKEAVMYYGEEVDEEIAFLVYCACIACHNVWVLDN